MGWNELSSIMLIPDTSRIEILHGTAGSQALYLHYMRLHVPARIPYGAAPPVPIVEDQ